MELIESLPLGIEISKAKALLSENESLPDNVIKILQFCNEHMIGVILSHNANNTKVDSCKYAREFRSRLGHIGIPLYDELKSIILQGTKKNGDELIIAAHCRGHMSIDFNDIRRCCGLKYDPFIISKDDLQKDLNMDYGTVNPILVEINAKRPVIQIFDEKVFIPISEYPGTMMTNAGDLIWGMEFDPMVLKEKLKETQVGCIAYKDTDLKDYELEKFTRPKSIGIITGNNPNSGILLWEKINHHIAKKLGKKGFAGDISLPFICVVSCRSMGLSMELDKRNSATKKAVLDAVQTLLDLNKKKIDIITIACHTTQYYTKQIREVLKNTDVEFMSMPDAVVRYINKKKINNIAILGIDYVADLIKGYSAYGELKNIADQLPENIFVAIRELGYKIKKLDEHRTFQKYSSILKCKEIKSENVLLAMTELSLLYEHHKRWKYDKNIIEPLDIYAEVIAEKSLGIYKNGTGDK